MGHGFNSWWPQLNIIMRTGWNLTKVSSAPDNSNSSGNILNSDNFADHLFTGGFHCKSRELEVATFVGFAAKSIYFARQFVFWKAASAAGEQSGRTGCLSNSNSNSESRIKLIPDQHHICFLVRFPFLNILCPTFKILASHYKTCLECLDWKEMIILGKRRWRRSRRSRKR